MSLKSCVLSWHAFLSCSSHAFSTSNQEIMGLLLGNWNWERCSVHVEHIMILARTDKKPDRCEVSVEQLAAASTFAEEMSAKLNKTIRVCGWYHSHPAITVHPSHVDLRTQMQYQLMHKGFVGLIFAVFQIDSFGAGKLEMTAFQSIQRGVLREDPMCINSAELIGKSIQLMIAPSIERSSSISTALDVIVNMQNILFNEERSAYFSALNQFSKLSTLGTDESELLEKMYCSAVYSKSLAALMAESMLPLQKVLLTHLRNLQKRGDELSDEISQLKDDLATDRSLRLVESMDVEDASTLTENQSSINK